MWHVPAIPAPWHAKAEGSLQPVTVKPTCAINISSKYGKQSKTPAWAWHTSRHTDHMKTIQSPEINLCDHWSPAKVAKKMQWRNWWSSLSSAGASEAPHIKVNSKWTGVVDERLKPTRNGQEKTSSHWSRHLSFRLRLQTTSSRSK